MSVPDIDTAMEWRGRTVRDEHGEELGTLSAIYLDRNDMPAWAGVKRGRLRATETIVPLAGASEDDGDLRLAFDQQRFDDAPDVEPDVALSEDEERLLHEHYGREWAAPSGEETDTAMTRSEEEVDFGKRTVQRSERVRLRKVLVEDQVTKTVPVRREVIQLETEPPPAGDVESVEDVDDHQRS
jgi:hypothetical protein